ncbi:uncharacterized protein LOC109859632 isoform X2 [Pseudomyrmex gracilis]|uniref:uncharacterized protein LOC109859632 isoform X2 n=1 Tax=Pseudomyrmex gracilis TaxID=219809 RepID=UPI0009956FAF|nr:uncharacterized protein LOC109859632 isoform X2 [Pseudomyrmex gracilis]
MNMTDDPNHDMVPVKEGSYADICASAIDPRERHLVCKLDRYELEDKYLRLLDEASNLKKLSNCQEDKIKRLGTKLLRLAGTPRSCGLALDIEDKNRTASLEYENIKLKEKIAVMRNQLLSHTMSSRSTSRSRTRPTSSGLVTCRSENNRTRVPSCQCIVGRGGGGDDDNYLVKIEKLEAQKKDMTYRIAELEKELALVTSSQKEKIAENLEYIRVWRQMKQLNDKLITAQEKNVALTTEINGLRLTLEQTTKNNQEIVAVLTSERTRLAEIDEQMLKARDSQFTLREKDEQIRDLMSEIKILQQHNNELIMLTSKYSQVEMENGELKKKLSEHAQEQQTLKSAFNNEQANIVALKTTNEQLLAKLQQLQANIDTLKVQLADDAKMTISNVCARLENFDKQPVTSQEQCKKCCEMLDKITQLEKCVSNTRENWQPINKSVQTRIVVTKNQDTMTTPNNEIASLQSSPLKELKNQETNSTRVLSREKILKLLDQAQINTPLDTSMIASKEDYASILNVAQRHSNKEVSFRDGSDLVQEVSQKIANLENSSVTLVQIFLILFDVLQECLSSYQDPVKTPVTDVNNNIISSINTSDIKQDNLSANTTETLESDITRNVLLSTAVRTDSYTKLKCEEKSTNVSMKNADVSTKVTFSPTTYEKCRKPSCLRAEKRLTSSLQKVPCKIEYLKDELESLMRPTPSSPLLITDKQGLIEIHISRLQLSTSVTKIPEAEDICNLLVYISWDLWGEKTAHTPRMKCPNLNFNSSCVYHINDLFSFFKNVLSDYLIFRVNIVRRDNTSCMLARAKVSIKDILDYPQNKLHYIVPVNGVISCFCGINFGQLSLWTRLSCNVEMVEAFKKQCGIIPLRDAPPTVPPAEENAFQTSRPNFPAAPPQEKVAAEEISIFDRDAKDNFVSEYSNDRSDEYETENSDWEKHTESNNECSNDINESDEDSNNEVITIKSPAFATSQDDESNKKSNARKDTPSLAEFKSLLANDVLLLQESRSTIRDINEVFSKKNWERYRQRSLLTCDNAIRPKSLNVDSQDCRHDTSARDNKKDTITIEIVSMRFLENSPVMKDDDIQLLYVEYSFLGHYGKNMETIAVKKPKRANREMIYNFRKKFRVNERTHPRERDMLRDMLTEKMSPNVTFIVVCEPMPDENETKECEEIGYATLNLKKYILGDDQQEISLSIVNDLRKQIGVLKIIVWGYDVIRQFL